MEGDPVCPEQSENSQNGHEGKSSEQVNGVSNGYSGESKHHKSSHKDKHRDRDHRSKDHKSSRDKDRHSSSKDKDRSKDHKSSRDKDREREKDRERDKERSDRDKDKHRSDKDKDRSKSSSSKDHKSDKDRSSSHHTSSRDKDKHKSSSSSHDKDKHKSSSSSSRDKDRKDRSDRERSDKDRGDRERSDKDRSDRDRSDRDKDRKSSSSKHHSSSRDKDRGDRKHRDEKKDKHKSEKQENGEREKQPEEDVEIKNEPYSQEDINVSAASSCDYNMSQFNKSEPQFEMTNGDAENSQDEVETEGDDGDVSQDDDDKLEIKEEEPDIKEESDDDEVPLSARVVTPKRQYEEDDEDEDIPLAARKKAKKEKKKEKKAKKRAMESDDDDEEYEEKPKKAKIKKEKVQVKQEKASPKKEIKQESSPGKKKKGKKEENEPEVWKWWEEEKKDDGTKWNFLEHKGPVFAPPYERLPENVKFYYDGKEMRLSQDAEEVAGFYAKMLEHDYTSKEAFNNNFFKDWRKVMTDKERSTITKLEKCNFKPMHAYFMDVAEKNRNRTKEEKEAIKKQNAEIMEEYGFCTIDGHREKIGNFRIEPPGLFRGRGEHPKMGMLKKRVNPEDISINCSKKSKIPVAPEGHKWKDVRHDPMVTWLCSWTENVQNQVKYIMLNPSSKLKGEKDWQKYETARRLAKNIDKIRLDYREDWKSKEMRIRQRAVALYFIDKLALRAGNEKDEDQADTVGCCSLRVEHISLEEHKDGKDYVVIFDFLGKDSIRYYNEVPVEKRVFKNLQLFMENKAPGDDLFDRLNTAVMNKHLNELMEGLSAKVFRTYNASWTLQQQLDQLTNEDDSVAEKMLSYNRANRAVAILCNHQRSVPKSHQKSMEKLKEKIDQKRDQITDAEMQVKDAKRSAKGGSVKEQVNYDKKKKMLERLKDQLKKLEVQETDRDENKTIALGTSKLNYLDPRISVAWCKKYDVPIDKVYNKTQRDKFRWAIDMADADYVF